MDTIKSLINKKVILGLFGLVIAVEIVWALWTLFRPQTSSVVPVLNQQQVSPQVPTIIKLDTQTPQVKTGAKFAVSIQMSSDKKTDGADIIIKFDPALLGVEVIGQKEKLPVILGSLYDDYPVNKLDAKSGEIVVSGISTTQGGVLGNGLFGSIVFSAKKPGQTKIAVDFTKSSTTDSNVLQSGTGEDILSAVENLEVTIE